MKDYYVYVYIDPRNHEEFYFGKGKGSRKFAHINDNSDSEKTRRIKEIEKLGLAPIVRVLARNLSESDAFLVEKTLLWKLGRQLTNISSGHYADKFRPHFSIHTELSGFDFENGLYYYNVGDGPHRNWDDYVEFGFISAGGGKVWRDAILAFNPGDAVAAYLKGSGFVGIGIIAERAEPVRFVTINGVPLLKCGLRCTRMDEFVADDELCEYVAKVRWLRVLSRSDAKWLAKAGIFTTPSLRASLDNQPKTVEFLEREFGINISEIIR